MILNWFETGIRAGLELGSPNRLTYVNMEVDLYVQEESHQTVAIHCLYTQLYGWKYYSEDSHKLYRTIEKYVDKVWELG